MYMYNNNDDGGGGGSGNGESVMAYFGAYSLFSYTS